MTRMATVRSREFEALRQLVSPSSKPRMVRGGPVNQHQPAMAKQIKAYQSYWILIGTLLIASSTGAGNHWSAIRFHSSLWTMLSLGFEIVLARSFGWPQHTFRTFRIISRTDEVWSACVIGDLEQVERLIADGKASPYDCTEDGATLLHVRWHF